MYLCAKSYSTLWTFFSKIQSEFDNYYNGFSSIEFEYKKYFDKFNKF